MKLKALSTILILVLPTLLLGRGGDGSSPTAPGANSTTARSPFGIFSPLGELQLDRSTFATPADISEYLKDSGVKWVQEMPFVRGFDALPNEINVYSRVGKEAGMNSSRINDPGAVERYKTALRARIRNQPTVKYWEVDTEPDGLGGWRNNVRGYAGLLRITYLVIKRECADCKVMFGGLSGGQAVLDTHSAAFLEEALKAGAAGHFDGLEFKRHHTSSRDYSLAKNEFESLGTILAKYGVNIHAIPVFVETAMYDGDPNNPVPKPLERALPVQTEGEQAQGLLKTYVYGLSLGIDKIFWNLVFERSDYEPNHARPFPQNPFNHYGLIHNPTNNDGLSHKKLAYFTYKKMVEMLEGSDWKGMQTIRESGNVRIYKFVKYGKPIFVAWWDYLGDPTYSPGKTLSVSLTGLEGAAASVTEAVPRFATGAEVTTYSTAFRKVTLAVSNGTVRLSLGDSAIFVQQP